MSPLAAPVQRLVVVAVALAVLAAGSVYALTRPARSVSHTALVLVPSGADPADLPAVLDGFDRAGTAGTFVELLASGGVRRAAGSPPVTLTVRAVPASRVITVDATGPRDTVRPALAAIVAQAQQRQGDLGDLWKLRPLQAPDGPVAAGPSRMMLLAATLVLSLLAGTVTQVVLTRGRARPDDAGSASLTPPERLRATPPIARDAG